MKLADVFRKVAAKRLSKVEIDKSVSNQHEFNGVQGLKEIFGTQSSRFPVKGIYLNDSDDMEFPDGALLEEGYVTWYDSRENQPHRSAEYRLYYSLTHFLQDASENDLLIVGFDNEQVWLIVAEQGSTIESQLLWLFGFLGSDSPIGSKFEFTQVPDQDHKLLGVENMVLEKLGFQTDNDSDIDYEKMLAVFNGVFPSTREFSIYARKESGIDSSLGAPDDILLEWWNHEERLFRALEKHIVEDRLSAGRFENVDEFIDFAKSVMNRRYSRAGHAFENHLEQIFSDHGLSYSRGKTTEGKSKPDFIFPSVELYRKALVDESLIPSLTMLGAKTTCKDRWRQVTKEAALIETKHLVTLEPSISVDQTNEMQSHSVQLVVPKQIITTYRQSQQEWLLNVEELLAILTAKQNALGGQ